MVKTEKQGFFSLLRIAAPYLALTTLYTIIILAVEEHFGDHIYKIPGQVVSVFGLAVAFFLGFRMNSAYDRWWEARKIFGELTNTSRSFVVKVVAYFNNPKNVSSTDERGIQRGVELIRLCKLYIKQLKNEMHNNFHPGFDAENLDLLKAHAVNTDQKISNEILIAMTISIEHSFSQNAPFEKSDLMQHINRFYDVQGKAERIKNTAFLKIYSAFTKIVVGFYVLLIPFLIGDIDLGGEDSGFEFLSIPIMAVLSTAFLTINRLANLYAEPFSDNRTSVNIDKIIETIEADCDVAIKKCPSL